MTATSDLAARFVEHDGVHLVSHSVGLPVRGTDEALADVVDAWCGPPGDTWPRWLDQIHRFRASLATLIGADVGSTCPQPSVSSALTKLVGALDVRSGPVVLLSEHAFPSLGFVLQRTGCDVRFVGRELDATDPEVWSDHLTPDVDIVLATHVHSSTGELTPVSDITAIARERSIVSIVDVAQSVGVIPIDVSSWNADAVIGSCVKWLSGGPGAAWLWIAPEIIERCRPTDVGWFSHEDPFEFDIHRFRDAPEALRFWGGTPSVLPFAVARHAIDTIADIGVETIRRHNQRMIDRLVDALDDRVASPHDSGRRGGTCVVRSAASDVERLGAEGIHVDRRALGLRLSPHVHTTDEDLDRVLASLQR